MCLIHIVNCLTRTSPKTQFARTKTVPNMYPNKISCTEGTSHINVGTSPKSCNFHFESSMREINIAVLVLHAIASKFLVQLLLILPPPHSPGVEASNNLHWRRRKSSSTVERPSSFGLEKQEWRMKTWSVVIFLRKAMVMVGSYAIYASLEPSVVFQKKTSLPKSVSRRRWYSWGVYIYIYMGQHTRENLEKTNQNIIFWEGKTSKANRPNPTTRLPVFHTSASQLQSCSFSSSGMQLYMHIGDLLTEFSRDSWLLHTMNHLIKIEITLKELQQLFLLNM